jgi:hypothetical protein
MSNISNDEIIRLAALRDLVDQVPEFDAVTELERKLSKLDSADFVLVIMAAKLTAGKQYQVTSDNPETIDRCSALAKHMGARITKVVPHAWSPDETTTLLFSPPAPPSGLGREAVKINADRPGTIK